MISSPGRGLSVAATFTYRAQSNELTKGTIELVQHFPL
jgi:hypothetical protein